MEKFFIFIAFLFMLFIFSPVVKIVNDNIYDNYTYTSLLTASYNVTAWPIWNAWAMGWPWIFPLLGIVVAIILFFRREEPEPYYPEPSMMRLPRQPKLPKQPKPIKPTKLTKQQQKKQGGQQNLPPPPIFFGGK